MIYNFDTKEQVDVSKVGGKAKSLIAMTQAKFNVPAGIVITSDFFAPWIDAVKKSSEWAKLLEEITPSSCGAVKRFAKCAKFSDVQKNVLNSMINPLDDNIFAVRSSSPQEDLADKSFAGMYETYLGIKRKDLEKHIIDAFSSMYDYRVIHYKDEANIDYKDADMAVIVQKQIDSDVSGVGFSINPISNDYDEAVINANFGLGESVVSGKVSPDQYTVNKIKNEIIEKTLGSHEVMVNINKAGGVKTDKPKEDGYSLSDEKALLVSEIMTKIEAFYGFPVDIEWAFEGETLYILQARPITAYIQIEPNMMTKPGEKRMLYMDINLVDSLTSNVPILPLTIDWFYDAFMMFTGPIFGDVNVNGHLPPKDGLFFCGTGRVYINMSQILHLGKLEKLTAAGEQADKQLTQIAKNIDSKEYIMEKPLPYLKLGYVLRKSPRWIINARKLISKSIKAYFKPQKFYNDDFKPKIDHVIEKLKSDAYNDIPLSKITTIIDKDIDNALFTYGFSAIIPLMISLDKIPKLVKDGSEKMDELADAIFLGTNDNESIELGISMFHMAKLLKKSDFDDLDQLAKRIKNRDLSDAFLSRWDEFIAIYAFRGPNELELSNYRYGDKPTLALQQMSYMVDSEYNPYESKKSNIVKREQAYETICSMLKGRKLKQFKINYDVATLYATARDIPKYIWLLQNGIVRKRALFEGQAFVDSNHLDEKEDIFFLYFKEIEKAQSGEDIDLRKIVVERKALYKKFNHIDSYPLFIDSRGRIAAAKVDEVTDGAFKGHGISRGVAKGRIKVLKNPTEKPIEKGDVLVTYTTDPGWTPLFVNAQAIILQVGGPLQHGGVVAREYAKPCVAGIPNIYDQFFDGQMVEVDGTNGIVTIIE
jgi:rifampicin phosphotransferase